MTSLMEWEPFSVGTDACCRLLEVLPGRSFVALRSSGSLLRAVPALLRHLVADGKLSKSGLARLPSTCAVIADCRVPIEVTSAVCESLADSDSGMAFRGLFLIPSGEASKTPEMKNVLEDWLLARDLGKDSVVVSVGGGVTGDLVGYVASTFMRGLPVAHFTTSLMAMVDSAVGGKTAVNSSSSGGGGGGGTEATRSTRLSVTEPFTRKNLFGTIHQPVLVVMDPQATLRSLPPRVLREAFAEIVKYDVIFSSLQQSMSSFADSAMISGSPSQCAGMFPSPAVSFLLELANSCPCLRNDSDITKESGSLLTVEPSSHAQTTTTTTEKESEDIFWLQSRSADWESLIAYCVEAKTLVVRQDEREVSGIREVLNVGHTIGHAIEGCFGLMHGEAVAVGLVLELELSLRVLRGCTFFAVWQLKTTLASLGLPVRIPYSSPLAVGPEADALLAIMSSDKKNRAGAIHCSLVRNFGQPCLRSVAVSQEDLRVILTNTLSYQYEMRSSMGHQHSLPEQRGMLGTRVRIPGSKSHVNRAIVCAVVRLLCENQKTHKSPSPIQTIVIENALVADDSLLLIGAFQTVLSRTPIRLAFDADLECVTVSSFSSQRHDSYPKQHDLRGRRGGEESGAKKDEAALFVGNSGTTGRFIAAFVAAASASMLGGLTHVTIHGTNNFHLRPVGDLVSSIRQAAAAASPTTTTAKATTPLPCVVYLGAEGCFPIRIQVGCLRGSSGTKVSGSVSSQFLSALILASPLLEKKRDVETSHCDLEDENNSSLPFAVRCNMKSAVSRPFIHMTAAVMEAFGWNITAGPETECGDGQPLTSFTSSLRPRVLSATGADHPAENLFRYVVEPDYSSASYFIALRGLLVASGHPKECFLMNTDEHLASGTPLLQPDAAFYDKIVKPMTGGGESASPFRLTPLVSINMADLTDCFITAAVVLMPFAHGTSVISGIANQRLKECNRIAVVVEGLQRLGLRAQETKDGLAVAGAPERLLPPRNDASAGGVRRIVRIACCEDHRIAMAFATLGLFLAAMASPVIVEIDDRRCVEKTFPTFFAEADIVRDMLCAAQGTSIFACTHSSTVKIAHASETRRQETLPQSGERGARGNQVDVVLIGMRSCGKTTLGRTLAEAFGCPFVDVDQEIGAAAAQEQDLLVVDRSDPEPSSREGSPPTNNDSSPRSARYLFAKDGASGSCHFVTCSDIVSQVGWDGFRSREFAAMRSIFSDSLLDHCHHHHQQQQHDQHRHHHFSPPWYSRSGHHLNHKALPLPIDRSVRRVVACGGGFVDHAAAFSFIQQLNRKSTLVVFIDRDVEDLVRVLDLISQPMANRPAYPNGESFEAVYARRRPKFEILSHVIMTQPACPSQLASCDAVRRLVVKALRTQANAAYIHRVAGMRQGAPHTHFLSIMARPSDVAAHCSRFIDDVAFGVDMLELRLDAMLAAADGGDFSSFLSDCVALTEEWSEAVDGRLPLLVTYRTADEGGCGSSSYFSSPSSSLAVASQDRLAAFVARLARVPGVAFLDVQLDWLTGSHEIDLAGDMQVLHRALHLLSQRAPRSLDIVISWHATAEVAAAFASLDELFAFCHQKISVLRRVVAVFESMEREGGLGRRLIVPKVVVPAMGSSRTSIALHEMMRAAFPCRAFIAVCTGPGGEISRAMNAFLTPVTHERLALAGAPGQLSLRQLLQWREKLGLRTPFERAAGQPPTRFFVSGTPVSASRSPAIHNHVFAHILGMDPEKNRFYDTLETMDAALVTKMLHSGLSGGASVTIPLKESMMDKCTERSPDVDVIGALNTIVVLDGIGPLGSPSSLGNGPHGLAGFNTDWIGLYERLLQASLSLSDEFAECDKHAPSVVIGAGGTARAAVFALALLRPCAPIHIVNRTEAKAMAIADAFAADPHAWWPLRCPAIRRGWPTHPSAVLPIFGLIGTTPPGASDLPRYATHLPRLKPAVVVDFAYTQDPTAPVSAFAALSADVISPSETPAVHITGLQVLSAQAMHQQRLWWSMGESVWPASVPYFPLRSDIEEVTGLPLKERK
jgi:3-dehydroquinate synthetase/5-enolpyruvylshikimate-3-phosphate synthase/shikimate 5-dehydrogenase/shikimate kinase/3-dehydroquinate dehydratase